MELFEVFNFSDKKLEITIIITSEITEVCLNLGIGFFITWLVLPYYKKKKKKKKKNVKTNFEWITGATLSSRLFMHLKLLQSVLSANRVNCWYLQKFFHVWKMSISNIISCKILGFVYEKSVNSTQSSKDDVGAIQKQSPRRVL